MTFDFDRGEPLAITPPPSPATLQSMRETVAPQLAEVYPQFAAQIFGAQVSGAEVSGAEVFGARTAPA